LAGRVGKQAEVSDYRCLYADNAGSTDEAESSMPENDNLPVDVCHHAIRQIYDRDNPSHQQ